MAQTQAGPANIIDILVAPIEDEAHHNRVTADLEQARKNGDEPGVMLLLAQLSHSQSWRPQPGAIREPGAATDQGDN